jgi:hypothetical protein
MPPPEPPEPPKKKVKFVEPPIEQEEIDIVGLDIVAESVEQHVSLTRSRSPSPKREHCPVVESPDLTLTLQEIQQERHRHETDDVDPMILSLSEERYQRMGQQLDQEFRRGGGVMGVVQDVIGGDGGGGGAIAAAVLLMLIVSAMPTHESGGY